MSLAIALAEQGRLPDFALRMGIRYLLKQRIKEQATAPRQPRFDQGPVAVQTAAANEQHYEVPAAFYDLVLGPRLKYSCCYYEHADTPLADAETHMLRLTGERAGLADGMRILDLGCGWGAFSLWAARAFPAAHITAVSNSRSQARHIQAQCDRLGLQNIRTVTADINQFRPTERFDRIVSVEMLEHVRNYALMFERIHGWLNTNGSLFAHVFCHRTHAYTFEPEGAGDWMARHFFSGGTMPSWDLFLQHDQHLRVAERWPVSGLHYARTCGDWLDNLDRRGEEILRVLEAHHSPREARMQCQRWRMFFLACQELFQFGGGDTWHVGHYRLMRREDA